MSGIRVLHLDGRIGKDGAELKQTVAGKPYLRFSLANNYYAGGQEKTEWFDVKVFDPFIIESKKDFLTKGTYVHCVGSFQTDVNVDKNNKVWVNQYMTAYSVETPSIGRKFNEGDIVNMSSGASVTTNATQKQVKEQEVQVQIPVPQQFQNSAYAQQPQVQPTQVQQPQYATSPAAGVYQPEDELPF